MKKIFALLIVGGLMSFDTQSEKTFDIKMSESEVTTVWNTLENVQKYLNKSNLPHQDVVNIVIGIDSVKSLIAKQVRAQTEPDKKK